MAVSPLLSILIPLLTSRRVLWQELLAELERQTSGLSVQVLTDEDDGRIPTGTKRQTLMNRATGRYLAHVDDDDWLAPDYVASLLAAIAAEPAPDVVGFDVLRRETGRSGREILYGRGHPDWIRRNQVPDAIGRRPLPPSHLCAWRADLARRVPWLPIWRSDDLAWVEPAAQLIRRNPTAYRCAFIARPLYIYRYAGQTSPHYEEKHSAITATWASGGVEWFLRGSSQGSAVSSQDVLIAAGGLDRIGKPARMVVYAPGGGLEIVDRSSSQPMGIIPFA